MEPITITLGWWIIPTLITIVAVGLAFWPRESGGGYPDFGAAFLMLLAIIAALVAWVIYLALT